MSTMNDIRAHMARQAGPVTATQVAEALDLEAKKVRQAMYQAARQEAGIEALDDGTYSLIPGWKPSREPATDTAAAPAKALRKAKQPKAKQPQARKSKAKRVPKAEAPKRQAATPGSDGFVRIRRSSLAVLVDAVLAGDVDIKDRLRGALRDASSCATEA